MKERSCVMRGEGDIICDVVQKVTRCCRLLGRQNRTLQPTSCCVHVVRLLLTLLITPLMEQRHLLQLFFSLSLLCNFHHRSVSSSSFVPGQERREGARGWGDQVLKETKGGKENKKMMPPNVQEENLVRAGGEDETKRKKERKQQSALIV